MVRSPRHPTPFARVACVVVLGVGALAGGVGPARAAEFSQAIVVRDVIACWPQDLAREIAEAERVGDGAAHRRLSDAGLGAGQCAHLFADDPFYIADEALNLACLAQLRTPWLCHWVSRDLLAGP